MHDDEYVDFMWWVFFPALFGTFLYVCTVVAAWPYARAHSPLWLIVIAILVPPILPFLLAYVLLLACLAPPRAPELEIVPSPLQPGVVVVGRAV